jgi:hypothetical protein
MGQMEVGNEVSGPGKKSATAEAPAVTMKNKGNVVRVT